MNRLLGYLDQGEGLCKRRVGVDLTVLQETHRFVNNSDRIFYASFGAGKIGLKITFRHQLSVACKY